MSKLKKIGILSIFLVMLLPATNVFALDLPKSNGYGNGFLDNLEFSTNADSKLYDNDLSSSFSYLTGTSIFFTFQKEINLRNIYVAGSTLPSDTIINIYTNDNEIVSANIDTLSKSLDIVENSVIKVEFVFEGLENEYVHLSEVEFFGSDSDIIPPNEVTNLQQFINGVGNLSVSYELPTDNDFSHVNVYKNGVLDKENHITTSYSNGFIYGDVVKVTTVDTSGNESQGVEITLKQGDIVPPTNVTNIQTTVTSESVKLTYDLPLDEDFSHLEIHRDSQLVADKVVLNSYVDSPLLPDTHYVYTIKSVDVNGNVSSGEIVGVTTVKENDIVPPNVPTGLDTTIHNSALSINWNSVDVVDLEGYNIYVNGVKHNSTLIIGTSYNLYNLENGVSYDIQVSAVDTSGNESALSSVVSNTPSMDALPIFKMGYSLEDVSKSVSNWFSEFWLILAFATSIPLSFLIANRIKSLFIA